MNKFVVVMTIIAFIIIVISTISLQVLIRKLLKRVKELYGRVSTLEYQVNELLAAEEARKIERDAKGRYRRRVTDEPNRSEKV